MAPYLESPLYSMINNIPLASDEKNLVPLEVCHSTLGISVSEHFPYYIKTMGSCFLSSSVDCYLLESRDYAVFTRCSKINITFPINTA